MIIFKNLASREDWLENRGAIGGSDAAAIVGMNPYMTNTDLWEYKTHRKKREDISNKSFVKYGTESEKYLRELFKLDFPEYEVGYSENNMFKNTDFPFAHASLDGWLKDKDGRLGVWECKTTNILNSQMLKKWDGGIPDNYYIQVIHYLMVTGFEFAVIKAQLKFEYLKKLETRHYFIERSDVLEDIEFLKKEERRFWECVQNDICPDLRLPEIKRC